jgi:RNase P subunit RPR2
MDVEVLTIHSGGKDIRNVATNLTKGLNEVECQCPKCGTKHMKMMIWIGRGTPRKFCENCKKLQVEFSEAQTTFYDWRC